jgi:hypothetical protein
MQTHPSLLSAAVTLGAAMFVGAAAIAADLPKEGTFSGNETATGTYKVYPIGKDRAVLNYELNGVTVGSGLVDHVTRHCYGEGNIAGALEWYDATCIMTDTTGDQVIVVGNSDKHQHDKAYNWTGTFIAGTGKYAGITGDITWASESPAAFRTADPATSFGYAGTIKGSYKLP